MSQPKASPMELPLSNPFFDHPILNSPYDCPQRHWELDADGQPTQQILATRRRAEFITPIPKPKKRKKKPRKKRKKMPQKLRKRLKKMPQKLRKRP